MNDRGLRAVIALRRPGTFDLDVDLAIPAGTTAALLGPNGAGKSTALLAIAGLLPIDRGMIELGGAVLDAPEDGVFVPAEERDLGIVFQDRLLFPHLDAADNVAFGLRSRGVDREEAGRRAVQWLDRVGLAGRGRSWPRELSGGEAQRVALARALATDPGMLLLDEPLAALDVSTRVALRRRLAEHLGEFAGPRLLITHDPADAFLLADRIHVIEGGRITQVGTADELWLRPRTGYVADLAGVNLLRGTTQGGVVDTGAHRLRIADAGLGGDVLVTIPATAVSLHRGRPEGSQRNTWATTIELVERLGDRVRVRTGAPLPLTVEVTVAAAEELGLQGGQEIWVALKATEIGVEGAASG